MGTTPDRSQQRNPSNSGSCRLANLSMGLQWGNTRERTMQQMDVRSVLLWIADCNLLSRRSVVNLNRSVAFQACLLLFPFLSFLFTTVSRPLLKVHIRAYPLFVRSDKISIWNKIKGAQITIPKRGPGTISLAYHMLSALWTHIVWSTAGQEGHHIT